MPEKKRSHLRGLIGELLCRIVLRLKFYRILATRYKTPLGEIDIVAARGRTLVFVEVKTRQEERQASEAISPHQQKRIQHAAMAFLAHHPRYKRHTLRFDAMFVVPHKWPRHIVNAFPLA